MAAEDNGNTITAFDVDGDGVADGNVEGGTFMPNALFDGDPFAAAEAASPMQDTDGDGVVVPAYQVTGIDYNSIYADRDPDKVVERLAQQLQEDLCQYRARHQLSNPRLSLNVALALHWPTSPVC